MKASNSGELKSFCHAPGPGGVWGRIRTAFNSSGREIGKGKSLAGSLREETDRLRDAGQGEIRNGRGGKL